MRYGLTEKGAVVGYCELCKKNQLRSKIKRDEKGCRERCIWFVGLIGKQQTNNELILQTGIVSVTKI